MGTSNRVITLEESLYRQAEMLAQHLQLTEDQLFARAIAQFVEHHANLLNTDEPRPADQGPPARHPLINQGDIYWARLQDAYTGEARIPHPYVILQENLLNHSRLETVVACALTSNLKRISETPGNLLLEAGEANLPRQSVVEVSKISTLAKAQLGDYIGSLTEERVNQILAGMRFLQRAVGTR